LTSIVNEIFRKKQMYKRAGRMELNDHFRDEVIAEQFGVPVSGTLPGRLLFTPGTCGLPRASMTCL
jgi:hypothetical protein